MSNSNKLATLALALFAFWSATAFAKTEAERWQTMARTDLEAVHKRVVEGHPGVIDSANPGFNTWVEQGYVQAKNFIPYVVSYDTAMAVMRYYTAGFEDGHLMYSDDIRAEYPILVNGWHIKWQHYQYIVATTLPDWPVTLPPIGATWIGCDGLSADEIMQTRFALFSDRRAGEESLQHRIRIVWMQLPIVQNLQECSFRNASGETLKLTVAYKPITTKQFFAALPNTHNSGARAANTFEIDKGVLWVRAGNFSLREDSSDRQELEKMLDGLTKVSDVRAIIFDARGNKGGDSGIGDKIFAAATGGLEFDQTDIDSLPRYFAQWRVSDYLIGFLDSSIERSKGIYGADSLRVAEDVNFRKQVAAARAAGQSWVEQDVGRTITREAVTARHGHLRRFNAKIALLTDSECVSACLDFADVVLQVPRVMHLGETTGADSVYMVGSYSPMPSGNKFVMPVKVWRNRARGNNQALLADIAVDLEADEVTVHKRVLRVLKID